MTHTLARWTFAALMIVAGISHLTDPAPFAKLLPPWVPAIGFLILITGVMEIALGLGLVALPNHRALIGSCWRFYRPIYTPR